MAEQLQLVLGGVLNAAKGMVGRLDSFSSFMDPETTQRQRGSSG